MIRINLATRKQADTTGEAPGSRSGSVFGGIDLGPLKELPILKYSVLIVASIVSTYLIDQFKEKELAQLDLISAKVAATSADLQKHLSKLQGYEAIKKDLDADDSVIRTKLETIQKLLSARDKSTRLLVTLANAIPQGVWLSEFKMERDHDIAFKGASLEYDTISDFMKNLTESANITDVNLLNTAQEKDKEYSRSVVSFEINAKRR